MNSYSHYTNEITQTELFDGLVGCGLFTSELPEFLCSKPFLTYVKSLTLPLNIKPTDYIKYLSQRNVNIPRQMAIPNPFSYANLCHHLKENWTTLQQYFEAKTSGNKYKVSRLHLRKIYNNCRLFEMNYKNFEKDGFPEQELIIKSKFIVEADVAKCFPSIYSHSIPWAIVDKNIAKRNKNDKRLWYNKLDYYIRNTKDAETNGLLIGPHVSNLISEIVLTKVDKQLKTKNYNYIRHIDDYLCFVSSYDEGEKFLIDLSDELRKYELSLNEKKSKIKPLPQASIKSWVNRLNHFYFTPTTKIEGKQALNTKQLKGFLDYATELMLRNDSNAAVLNYAIKIISKKHLFPNAKKYFINQLNHLVLLYPYLAKILDEVVFIPHQYRKSEIKKIADDIYEIGRDKNIFSACAFSLSWALKYDFKLKYRDNKSRSIESEDCIFLLLSFLYDKRGNKDVSDYKELAKSLKTTDFNKYWLFIYETLDARSLKDEFRTMKRNRISFVKENFR